jgi:hypothetical protein
MEMTLQNKVNYLSVILALSYTILIIILCNVDIDLNFRNNVVSASVAYLFQLMLSNMILVLHQQPIQTIPLVITAGTCLTSIIISGVVTLIEYEFDFQNCYIMHGLSCLNITLIGTYAMAKLPNSSLYNNFNNIFWYIISMVMVFYYQEYLMTGTYDYGVISYFLLSVPGVILLLYCFAIGIWLFTKLLKDDHEKRQETIPLRLV